MPKKVTQIYDNVLSCFFLCFCIFSYNNIHAQSIDCGFEKINSQKNYNIFQWADSKSFSMMVENLSIENYLIPAGSGIDPKKHSFVAIGKNYTSSLGVKNGDLVYLYNEKTKKNTFGFVFVLKELQELSENDFLPEKELDQIFYKMRVSDVIFKTLDAKKESPIILFFFQNSNKNFNLEFLANQSNVENLGKKLMQKADAYTFLEKCFLPNLKKLSKLEEKTEEKTEESNENLED